MYSPSQVQAELQASANKIAGKEIDITLPSNSSRIDVENLARSFDLSKSKTKRVTQRIIDMLNTRRDEEWLIKGTVPKKYISQ